MKKNMTVFLIFLALCIGTISVYGAEHPVLNDFYNGMLSYGDRIIVRENIVAKKTAVQTFTGQTVDEFKTYIQTNLPKNPTVRASYEKEVARLGQLYNLEGDADNAKKVLHAIILSAQNYETIKDLPPANEFFKSANLTPAFLVIAYDNVYTYNGFAEFDTLYGTDVRALIDRYFTSIAEKIYNDNKNIYINNLGGYAIKNLMGTGVILEKPDIIRYSIVMMDSAFDPSQWHGDGMWSEGTVSYGQQLVGNTLEAANALKKYVDPPGYVDKILNIKLNKTDLSTRWPMLEKIKATNTGAKYVNDSLMAFHDTHPNPKVSNNPNLPLTNFDPVELNHFGMYAMKSGNQTDAQQVNLLFPPISEGIPYGGGHYHGNFLSLSMFAGGMEVLPDAGYPFDVENNRYFHMSPVTHNESWISSIGKNATLGLNYDEYKSKSTRASVIAYDNKSADSMVQLIEASSLQPTDENIDTKRRLLFQIKMTESRSYTFDLQRLKGGNVHENFLRSSEDEDTTLTTDLTLVPLLENDIGTYLKNNKKIGQMTNTSSPFKEPKLDNTGKAFSFSWKGITSGTTFKAHMKEVKDGQTFVSTMPSLRRTEGDPLLKDNFPVPHMYMRREVSPNDVTEFGGVYEGYRNEELPLVNGVKWSEVLGNSMSTIAVVDLGEKE
ncbi:MAG: hypothetical protein RR957_05130, partial [Oscillospiraceae bacterium]